MTQSIYTRPLIILMRFKFLSIMLILLLISPACAALNPKSITDMTVKITRSGTIDITGDVDTLNLSLYIPQQGIKSITVIPNSWNYKQDIFGNNMIVMNWKNPSGVLDYRVEMTVENSAKQLAQKMPIGNDTSYLKETDSIVFDDAIRKFAYPYEKTLDKVAELTIDVNKLVKYDASLAGENKPSSWVIENRRGVCVEYTNLLAALLRVSDIPARYVVGYAYSSMDEAFTGHSWIEVPLHTDAKQTDTRSVSFSFDPTWLQGGYLDATHIKTATLLDNNQTETLYYIGRGSAEWKKNEDVLEIIDYTTRNITSISILTEDFTKTALAI